MGGTGSVLQHERKAYSRAEETRFLKLYNRQNREDKLSSGKLRAVGIENFEVRTIPIFLKFGRKKSQSTYPPSINNSVDFGGKSARSRLEYS